MYKKNIKSKIDYFIAFLALVIFSPLIMITYLLLILLEKENPFFLQERPGLNEKVFRIIKFRSMSSEKDKNGKLLSYYRIRHNFLRDNASQKLLENLPASSYLI